MRDLAIASLNCAGHQRFGRDTGLELRPDALEFDSSRRPACVVIDPVSEHRFCLWGGALTCYDNEGVIRWAAQLDVLLQGQDGGSSEGSWVYAAFLARPNSVFAAHSGGTLATIDVTSGGKVVELVGELEGGVLAAAWTADEALVAVATGSGAMVVMTSQWDVVAEASLPGMGISVEPVHLTWRNDSQHLVVSFCPASVNDGCLGPRCLRVLTQDLSVTTVGRNEDSSTILGLHAGSIAWSPDGELIACGMSVPARSRLQVLFA